MAALEARIRDAVADIKADLTPAQIDKVLALIHLLSLSTTTPFTAPAEDDE
jgi:hypothetical protein